jgi:hypothetical protein
MTESGSVSFEKNINTAALRARGEGFNKDRAISVFAVVNIETEILPGNRIMDYFEFLSWIMNR